ERRGVVPAHPGAVLAGDLDPSLRGEQRLGLPATEEPEDSLEPLVGAAAAEDGLARAVHPEVVLSEQALEEPRTDAAGQVRQREGRGEGAEPPPLLGVDRLVARELLQEDTARAGGVRHQRKPRRDLCGPRVVMLEARRQ